MTMWRALRRGGSRFAAVAMAVAMLVGCGEDLPESAAHVNGQPIPTSDVVALRDWYLNKSESSDSQQPAAGKEEVMRVALSFQIQATLVRQLANKMRVQVSLDDVKAFRQAASGGGANGVLGADSAMASHLGALSRAMARELFPDVDVSERKIDQAYRAQLKSAGAPWRARTDIALFRGKGAAKKFRAAIGDGEDFVSVAQKHDAIEADEVTVTSRSRLHPDVIRTIGAMGRAGEIAGPIHVKDYWVAVRLQDRTELSQREVAAIRSKLAEALSEEERYSRFQRWLDDQLRRADVEVDEEFGRWNKKSLAVV